MSNILDFTYGPLLKTNQTTDRTPTGRTTKDDGGFQRGIRDSKIDTQYDILTTGQYSGTTNITVNGNTDVHSNECVFDKVTSLMWSRNASAAVFGTGAQNLLWDGTAASNEDIFEYCDQANVASLSGYSDWRVSNITELWSLVINEPNGFANLTAFPAWPSNIWSATTVGDTTALTSALYYARPAAVILAATKTTTRFNTFLVRLGVDNG